jgi:UDP-N-acetylmuramate--alanine ligase
VLATGAQVLHLTGRGKADEVRQALEGVSGAVRWQVREYLDEMHLALGLADLVVCRAGAGMVSELAALGLPAVYVPLPVGNGEQRRNARDVVAAGGGLLVDDSAFGPAWVREHLPALLGPDGAADREQMAAAAASVGVRDGAARLADLVEAQVTTDATTVDADDDTEPSAGSAPATSADPGSLAALGRVHLVGVGGVGMSAVATLLAARGVVVSGSDAQDGPALDALRQAGVQVQVGHDASAVDGVDTVVVSSAVRESNPELAAARDRGLRVLHRSQALAALMVGRTGVAVAGAHGKTTTSAMIAVGLLHAGADPSFAIGGVVRDDTGSLGGARDGSGPFVAEADESDGSFLAYTPQVAVVTNVEPDHLDHYGTRQAFEQAFVDFASRVTGTLVVCTDDPGAARLAAAAERPGLQVLTYGAQEADVVVGPAVPDEDGWSTSLTSGGTTVTVRLPAPGDHNALNAAAAWAVLRALGTDPSAAAAALGRFRGTGRRFEDRGTEHGVRVVDDYAHHPTEVAAVLRSARAVAGPGRVLVLFQPHLFSRTKAFATQFGQALDLADAVVVTAVYAAREDPDPQVSGQMLVDAVPTADKARYVADRLEAAHAVAQAARPGDLVLTVGAGDVTGLGPVILADLAAQGSDPGPPNPAQGE